MIIKKVADKLNKFNYKLIMKNYKIKNRDYYNKSQHK